jgi:hypothetical protein
MHLHARSLWKGETYSEDAKLESQSEDVARRSFFSASRRADEATRQYDSALIVDAESHGSGWPLRPAKMATLEEHVKAATAAKR